MGKKVGAIAEVDREKVSHLFWEWVLAVGGEEQDRRSFVLVEEVVSLKTRHDWDWESYTFCGKVWASSRHS
ncbi:MAG TPA: hypothetical protein VFB12_19355 [Ktedonobacteraceae bacterium]|nr:hypothetical protein [Ktedonobacteraceae bacterium]